MTSKKRRPGLLERGMKEIKLILPEQVVDDLDELIRQSEGVNRQAYLAPIIRAVSKGELEHRYTWKSPVTGKVY
ncbi:hypothetical protein [Hymenobacter sp. GOD-10R]|uniref:hypothetical protein n=1 Tax=Hymenobacter sp. GOD-10R TaxID=3093922 RepID=UPI002D7945C1|nr:hypothetical protein [Hymenobacter sp. GOD-10R]WRQ27088.1 hypothetical protein SD425_18605 [Hymenobacter sp. GOD-10R]WRQ29139.1 hypothetical protein SD425_02535 [Hymenobacter sp. GOD-10R]